VEAETEMVPGASGGRPGVVEGFATTPVPAEGSADFTGVEKGEEDEEDGPLEEEGLLRDVFGFVVFVMDEDFTPGWAVCGRREVVVFVGVVVGGRRLLAVPGRVIERVGVGPDSCALLEGPKRTDADALPLVKELL